MVIGSPDLILCCGDDEFAPVARPLAGLPSTMRLLIVMPSKSRSKRYRSAVALAAMTVVADQTSVAGL